jgi:hypothetical protein
MPLVGISTCVGWFLFLGGLSMSRLKAVTPLRIGAIASVASLLAASAAFATGGSIAISSAPSLSLGASGLTQGLYATVWHVPPPPTLGGSTSSYGMPSPVSFSTGPAITDVQNVESYINSSSFYSAASGTTYTLPAASETFVNTADTFNYNGGYDPTRYFLGADAAGAALNDGNPWYSSIIDQMGYIKVASAGTYNFNLANADDAAAVYIGGTGITPANNAGTGTQIVAASWDGKSIPSTDQTASVTFGSAGYYPIEIMNYQQGGGANMKLSITNSSNVAPSFYTTNTVASSVTPTPPTPTPAPAPAATDEWNFAASNVNGSTVADIGTAGSAASAGTIVGTGASVSNGALVTTSTNSGNGMSIPASTFANYTGSFSVAVTFTRSTTDPTNQWGSLMAFGDKGTGSGQNFIILQPQRQDGTNLSSMSVQSDGVNTMLTANNDQPTPEGQKIQEVLTFNSTTNTLSLYINGVLQETGTPLTTNGPFSLASVADNTGTTSSPLTPQDGLGGLDSFGDPTTLANFYDLSIWNSALSANQVAGLAGVATPEPASLIIMAVAVGGLVLTARRRAKVG